MKIAFCRSAVIKGAILAIIAIICLWFAWWNFQIAFFGLDHELGFIAIIGCTGAIALGFFVAAFQCPGWIFCLLIAINPVWFFWRTYSEVKGSDWSRGNIEFLLCYNGAFLGLYGLFTIVLAILFAFLMWRFERLANMKSY